MKIKILSSLWGYDHFELFDFLLKIKEAGFDGIETWIPENIKEKKILYKFIEENDFVIVVHQHQANGSTFQDFKASYEKYLEISAEPNPLLINSHTGRDYFSFEQNLQLIDIALDFSERTGIEVVHETHRGRLGYSPYQLKNFFKIRSKFNITADFSHWVCVTESLMEECTGILDDAIERSRHIHARIGYEQGPQVSDPRAPEWQYAVNKFLNWWDAIVLNNENLKRPALTLTAEFGPPPYMHTMPYTQKPVADLFEINCYMKQLLYDRYNTTKGH